MVFEVRRNHTGLGGRLSVLWDVAKLEEPPLPRTRSGIKIGIVTGGLATVMETPTNRILRESRGLGLFKKSNEIKIAAGSSKF